MSLGTEKGGQSIVDVYGEKRERLSNNLVFFLGPGCGGEKSFFSGFKYLGTSISSTFCVFEAHKNCDKNSLETNIAYCLRIFNGL